MSAEFYIGTGVIITVVYGTSLHEMAHAFVAHWRGDPTPGREGRLTFNPFPHLYPATTAIILPILGYIMTKFPLGLALTPVDPSRMKHPMRSMVMVAVAGPIANFLWAGLLIGISWIPNLTGPDHLNYFVLALGALYNIIIGIFNLFPLPPLDGYTIIRPILPLKTRRFLDDFRRMGMLPMIFAFVVGSMLLQFFLPYILPVIVKLLPYPLS